MKNDGFLVGVEQKKEIWSILKNRKHTQKV